MANTAHIEQFELGPHRNFVYLILDPDQKRAAWVDPQSDLAPPAEYLAAQGYRLDWILLTHSHHDHVAGLGALAKRYPQANVGFHPLEEHRIQSVLGPGTHVERLTDSRKIALGSQWIEVLHTPGHSAGELSYFVASSGLAGSPPHLLTGDTLFIRDCGRTDFPTGSNAQMFASLQRIKRLPLETVIWPGHHYQPENSSTLAQELKTSPPLQARSVEELAALP